MMKLGKKRNGQIGVIVMLSSCIRYEDCFFDGFDVIQIYCKYHHDF